MSAGLLKLGGDTIVSALHRITVCVTDRYRWPKDWTLSAFVPLFKKGDLTFCAKYRTIT